MDKRVRVCSVCRTQSEHTVKETGLKAFTDYVNVRCNECGFNEMIPKSKLNEEPILEEVEEGGFDINNRDVGSDCEDGLCPVK